MALELNSGRVPVGTQVYRNTFLFSDVSINDIRGSGNFNGVTKNNITYMVFQDFNGDVYITKKHINGKYWSIPVLVSDISADMSVYQGVHEHINPTITIDDSGYIYIFYTEVTTAMFMRKSTNPYDISAWSAKQTIAEVGECTYPQPVYLGGTSIILFFQHKEDPVPVTQSISYVKTTDSGATWSERVKVAEEANYWMYWAAAVQQTEALPIIHFAAVRRDGGGFRQEFYFKTDDGGTTFKNISGGTLSLPFDSGDTTNIGANLYPVTIRIAPNGSVYLAAKEVGTNIHKFGKWNGSSFTWTTIANVSIQQYAGCYLDVISNDIIDAHIFENTDLSGLQDGGNPRRYTSTDAGDTWSLAEVLASGQLANRKYMSGGSIQGNPNIKRVLHWGTPYKATIPPGRAPLSEIVFYPDL